MTHSCIHFKAAMTTLTYHRVMPGERLGGEVGLAGFDVVGDGAEDGADLLRVLAVRVLAAAVGVRDPVEQLDQILDDQDHLVRLLARYLRYHGGRGLEQPDLKGLGALTALGHAELHTLAGTQRDGPGGPGGQRGRMHADLAAIIAGEEAEPLFGVGPVNLAGRDAR